MARIRTVKPEFWGDFRLARELSRDERLFYIALWNQADDEGRFLAHPRRLLGAVFPYDEDITTAHIIQWLERLASTDRLVLYEVGSEPYAQLTKFSQHQKINRPQASRIPASPFMEDSLNVHGTSMEDSSPEGNGMEGNGGGDSPPDGGANDPPEKPEKRKRKTALPEDWQPTEGHAALARKEGRSLETEAFKFRQSAAAHGRTYLDWNAAFTTWLVSEYGRNNGNGVATKIGKPQPEYIIEP
jgi:hypothetical protein